MNPTMETLLNRVSLRTYADKPIKKEDFEAIIEGAMRAPTAGNMMMYSILAVEEPEKKQLLSKTCDNQPFIAKAPLVLVFLADLQKWFDFYEYSGVREFCQSEGFEYRAPEEADLLLASCDALIAAQNSVIAAESLGIGSCYIGDIMENYEKHREIFNLPPWVFPITMLCFGYYPEGMNKVTRPRFDKKYVVFTDQYKKLSDEDFAEMFQGREFPPNNKFGAKNFGQFNYGRKTGAEFSKEMARSVREALKNWSGEKL